MLRSFCIAATVRQFLDRIDCPGLLKKASTILDRFFGANKRGTLMHDLHTLINLPATPQDITSVPWNKLKLQPLPGELREGHSASEALMLSRHSVRGADFAVEPTSREASQVFYRSKDGHAVPGVIQYIFKVYEPLDQKLCVARTFFAIRPYLPSTLPHNPFAGYADFGASIWSSELQETLDVVEDRHEIHHALRRQWSDDTYVFKSCNRVCSVYFCVSECLQGLLDDLMVPHRLSAT